MNKTNNKKQLNTTTVIKPLINGVASEYLSVNDRATQYGDGIFETILCDSRKLYYWQQHFERLKSSAKKLKIKCPEEQVLLADIATLLNDNPLQDPYALKIILTRGESDRGYQYPTKSESNRIVSLSKLNADYSSLLSNKLLFGDLCLCEQASINKNLAGIKHLNRLENVLARNEWGSYSTDAAIIDGIMLNANQHVIEGSMSNLFAVKNDQLFTPDLSVSGVNGIMRNVIIDLANSSNINVTITNLDVEELMSMDEVFITNSLIGMKAVSRLDKTEYTSQKVTNMIFSQLFETLNEYAKVV